jgi:hypothetical protein
MEKEKNVEKEMKEETKKISALWLTEEKKEEIVGAIFFFVAIAGTIWSLADILEPPLFEFEQINREHIKITKWPGEPFAVEVPEKYWKRSGRRSRKGGAVVAIGKGALRDQQRLREITLPNGLESIVA